MYSSPLCQRVPTEFTIESLDTWAMGGASYYSHCVWHFREFSQKLVSNFFSILAWTFPGMVLIRLQLPKAGYDWIALKVIFQGRKGLNLPLNCPFIQNLFSNFSSHLAWSFPMMVTMNCEEKDLIESL